MKYEYDELTSDVVREVGFRERYRGYDPADVDPLLEHLAQTVDEVRDEIERLEEYAIHMPKRRPSPSVKDVAALAALLHIGLAAREARQIVLTARERTGLTRVPAESQWTNEDRARALIHAPRQTTQETPLR